jgi:hypothetical protein
MSDALEAALLEASNNGRYPVIMDASTCTARMQKHLADRLKLYDFHEFAHDALLAAPESSPSSPARSPCTSIAACARQVPTPS